MFVSIKTHVIVLLIFATLLPFILLRIFAYPIIQSDLKTVVMDADKKTAGHTASGLRLLACPGLKSHDILTGRTFKSVLRGSV